MFASASRSPVSEAIEHALEQGESESAYDEICTVVQTTENGAKEATRVLKKKLNNKMAPNIVMKSLMILDACMHKCGHRFHIEVADKGFMDNYVKFVHGKTAVSGIVRTKGLELLQTWQDSFQGDASLVNIGRSYTMLQQSGVEFPDAGNLIAGGATPMPASSSSTTASASAQGSAGNATMSDEELARQLNEQFEREAREQQRQQQPRMYQEPPQYPLVPPPQTRVEYHVMQLSPGQQVECTQQQKSKIQGDLVVVRQNTMLLNDLTTISEGDSVEPEQRELVEEISRTCIAMRDRILELCSHVKNEDLIEELLIANDKLNDVLVKYEQYRSKHPADAPPPQQQHQPPSSDNTSSTGAPHQPAAHRDDPPPPFVPSPSSSVLAPTHGSVTSSASPPYRQDSAASQPPAASASASSSEPEPKLLTPKKVGTAPKSPKTEIRSLSNKQQERMENDHDDLFAL